MIHELMNGRRLIFGCGNTLFGDDGFGPAVVERLKQAGDLPSEVVAEDVGTSISDILFDIVLSQDRPDALWIVDAVSMPGRSPGQVFELPVENIPQNKQADFSMHQFPAVNLLQEMQDQAGVEVRVLAVQIEQVPDEVRPGLSRPVQEAIETAVSILRREVCFPQEKSSEPAAPSK